MKISMTILFACLTLLAISHPSVATEVKGPATQPATAPAVEERDPLKFSEEADAKAKVLRSVIEQEIKSLPKHAWAGQYYFGDGLGANVSLWLAPSAGFLYEWYGCLGLYDRDYGAVSDDGKGTIQLRFLLGGSRIEGEYVPVAWGERRYLIAKDQLSDFCDAVNRGREPRKGVHGMWFIRWGDEKKRADGLPAVPEEYRKGLTPRLESK